MSTSLFARLAVALARGEQAEAERLIRLMTPADALAFDADFEAWSHDSQTEPKGEGWRVWLMQAGRGFGKTRAGAEWITTLATQRGRPVRIALVGATLDEVRNVMIEGESGLLAVGGQRRRRPRWEPSRGTLTWPGGSVAQAFSAEAPDGLRGPQHHFAWCDELAKWRHASETWDNLQMTLRAGTRPRALVTTTPRTVPILKRIATDPRAIVTRGRTDDNLNLPDAFVEAMIGLYGGTRLGRQELDGELIEEVEGALWTRALIEERRARAPETLRRIVIGVDPPASAAGDACGIVACALGADGIGYVLGDHTVSGRSPEGWARAVAAAAEAWGAELVIVETNQGGEMVESVLRSADVMLPVRPVRARFGKSQRAEPVAALFEGGKARFAGAFAELEDELAGLLAGGGYEGPGRSPDRADAMVWAMAELMLGKARAPRVRAL